MRIIMGKVESNKLQKRNSLLNTAFKLFTTKGVNQTSIAEISEQAGIAKGTFYLYFKDKYDIRNKLVSHEASKLFMAATSALEEYCPDCDTAMNFENKMVFIVDYIIEALNRDKSLLNFISKNLSWGIFKEALTTNVAEDEVNFKDAFYELLDADDIKYKEPEIMLYLITEFVSSTSYSSILYGEPTDIETLKPYIINTVRTIIESHIE
jgi:AcrR family transcriptional regulator